MYPERLRDLAYAAAVAYFATLHRFPSVFLVGLAQLYFVAPSIFAAFLPAYFAKG